MTKVKGSETKPTSGSFRVRKRDGLAIQKKGFWLDAKSAHAFEIWCVTNRKDESEVVGELIEEFLKRQKR